MHLFTHKAKARPRSGEQRQPPSPHTQRLMPRRFHAVILVGRHQADTVETTVSLKKFHPRRNMGPDDSISQTSTEKPSSPDSVNGIYKMQWIFPATRSPSNFTAFP